MFATRSMFQPYEQCQCPSVPRVEITTAEINRNERLNQAAGLAEALRLIERDLYPPRQDPTTERDIGRLKATIRARIAHLTQEKAA